MSEELLLDRDPVTGTLQTFHYDDGKVTIQDRQDVRAIVEHNKAIQNDDNFRPTAKSEFRRVASIPMNVWNDMRAKWNKLGLSWEERQVEMRRFLNDPALRFFRTDDSAV